MPFRRWRIFWLLTACSVTYVWPAVERASENRNVFTTEGAIGDFGREDRLTARQTQSPSVVWCAAYPPGAISHQCTFSSNRPHAYSLYISPGSGDAHPEGCLTVWDMVILEKPVVAQLVKKFHVLYGTQRSNLEPVESCLQHCTYFHVQ